MFKNQAKLFVKNLELIIKTTSKANEYLAIFVSITEVNSFSRTTVTNIILAKNG